MASLNKATIIGNLGRDPEVRYSANGDPIANLAVATTDRWKDKATGEQKEATEWHRVAMFGRLAEIAAEYLKKGSQVYIEGKLQTRKYTDKEGVERYTTEIIASEMKMLGGVPAGNRGDNQESESRQAQRENNRPAPRSNAKPAGRVNGTLDEDDIPF